jgi:hypothetical protein
MVSSEGGVPVFFRAADGNESEAAVFSELIMDYRRHVDLDALFVADAALYNEENLKLMGKLKFVSRVPQTIKRAKDLLEAPDKEEGEEEGLAFSEAKNREGYHVAEVQAEYAALKQRWIVVHSEKRARGDLKRLEKRVEKHLEREHEEALKGLRYYRLKETMTIKASPYHAKPGRPRQDAPPPIIATASRSKTSAQRIFWHARRRRSLKTSARRDASSWPPACSTPRHCPRRRSWRRTWTNRWSKEASDS